MGRKNLGDFIREARAKVQEIDCDTLEGWMQMGDDVLVVDVRDQEAFQAGHLPRAVHASRGHLEALADPGYGRSHPELAHAHERRVVLYCDSGARSAMAGCTLQEMGFAKVYSLAGGLQVWEAEDRPVER